jgi:benzoate-CoA ligase
LRLIHALGKASKPAAAALRRHQNGAARLRVSGIWISPAEIEDVLAGIRSISETAAVLGESEIGLAEIVLYIVPAPGADGSAALTAARERLERALPPYKRPRRFEIAHDLPRTATGKVQRNKLRERGRLDPH